MTPIHLTFRQDLQGLRAIAILLVLFSHTGFTALQGGFVGVDVFFVLSGYLITGLLWKEWARNQCLDWVGFYARRLKRLLPALFVMLSFSTLIALWLLSTPEAREQLASAPFAATWISNLYFATVTLDYFNELALRDLFLHTWSLGVEEQFYLLWPLVLWLLLRRYSTPFAIIRSLGFIGIASYILSLYWTITLPLAAFYGMPARIWQFALGATVYGITAYYPRLFLPARYPAMPQWMLGTGLMLIIGSAWYLTPQMTYPGFWALLPTCGAALVIAAGTPIQPIPPIEQLRSAGLTHHILVWIGNHAYSLYLWHWPIFTLGFALGWQQQYLPTLLLMSLSFMMAIISLRWIELPFWKGRWQSLSSRSILFWGLFLMILSAGALWHGLRALPTRDSQTDAMSQQ